MPGGLLGDVLPWVYSRADAAKRAMADMVANPGAYAQQMGGLLQDNANQQQGLMAQAFSDPSAPFKVTDSGALDSATSNVMSGLLGFAPAGMIDKAALAAKYPDVSFSLSQRGDGGLATLSKVVVPKELRGQGVGSSFMGDLTQAADKDGATVALSPSSDFGGSKSRLLDFYKRFGFIPNKGRNIDYEISESMYRTPKK